jgi:anti-sigma regulatory factor (Ser/Thr protein kinase)
MINSANRGGPALISPGTGCSPPANGQAGLAATAEPAIAGLPRASINLPATPGQLAEARRFVASFVADPVLAADAVLCLSEVATNAVIHSNSREAGGRFTVSAERYSDGHLRVEVQDEGGRWIKRAKPGGQQHLGLMVVGSLASAWGIEGDGFRHRTVWFELHLPPGRSHDNLLSEPAAADSPRSGISAFPANVAC